MSNGNSHTWLSGMAQILVAGLLATATGGAVWSAIEVKGLSVQIESMTARVDRLDERVESNSMRLRRVERQ